VQLAEKLYQRILKAGQHGLGFITKLFGV
jgi:hypothetical protein